jgi:hypothetical protein
MKCFLDDTNYHQTKFKFDKTVPMPKKIKADMKNGINEDWYEWSLEKLGC